MSDSVFEAFLHFRLGNASQDELCVYSSSENISPQLTRRSDLPQKKSKSQRIVVVSDTHERHECIGEIPRGDIFIHAGDIMMTNRMTSHYKGVQKLTDFNEWLGDINCVEKIVVAGNHDKVIESLGSQEAQAVLSHATYLENSSVAVGDIKIWGSPLSSGRSGNSAFQSEDFKRLAHHAAQECGDVDIMVTHGPVMELVDVLNPSIHVWGHAHYYHGIRGRDKVLWGERLKCTSVNASIMDGKYNPSQFPVVVDYVKPEFA
jgi:predicted phosphodiesterase